MTQTRLGLVSFSRHHSSDLSERFWVSVVTDLNTLVNSNFLRVKGRMGMIAKILCGEST